MNLYISPGKFFALFIELNLVFGCKPFFSIKTCEGETIIDIPYIRIIYTPYRILKAASDNTHETRIDKSDTSFTRASEN